MTGFFTKYGDGGADVLPLTGLTKRQGRLLLETLQAPERLYLKKPTADLLDDKPQQTDETELGITYNEIDDYLEGKPVSDQAAEAIENAMFNQNINVKYQLLCLMTGGNKISDLSRRWRFFMSNFS